MRVWFLMMLRTVLNCVTVLFYSVLIATWGAHACNEETVNDLKIRCLPTKEVRNAVYCEVPYEDLSGYVRVRSYEGLEPTKKLWGSVETVKVFCMSHGNGLICSRPSPPFYTRHIFPIMQRKLSRDADSNGGPTCMKCFRGGEWQYVNLPFLYHYDGKNGNYRYKWTQYYGT